MRLFGRVRSAQKPPPQSFSTPQSVQRQEAATTISRPTMILGSPKDKYGMVDYEETEMPSPAFNGVQAITEEREPPPTPKEEEPVPEEAPPVVPTTTETGGEETEEEGHQEEGKDGSKKKKKKHKKKKKKLKKKKKKPESGEAEDDDLPIVVDRVPTAMEYESDDSIEKMIDERSRYSRYTTEYDELDLEPFDDDSSEQATDKYAGAGTIGQIISVMSDDSNPPAWRSWDEEEQKKKSGQESQKKKAKKKASKKKSGEDSDKFSVEAASTHEQSAIRSKPSAAEASEKSKSGQSAIRSKPSGAEMSGKSKASSRKKKYQDLREFRKTHSTDKPKATAPAPNQNLEEEVYTPYELPDFNNGVEDTKQENGSQREGGSKTGAPIEKSDSSSRHGKKENHIVKKGSDDQVDNNSRRSQDSMAGSQKSNGSKKKKTAADAEVPVSQSQSWIAYETFSGTFDKSKTSIPPVVSDTSSLTDPLKKHEKYAALLAKQPTIHEEGPPREIPASKPPKVNKETIRNQSLIESFSTSKDTASATGIPGQPVSVKPVHVQPLLSIASSESSDQHQNRYSVADPISPASAGIATWAPSPNSVPINTQRMDQLEKRLDEIQEANSGSVSSSSAARKSKTGTKPRDRYDEIKQKSSNSHSNSTETKSNRSSPKFKGNAVSRKQKDVMYTQSLINEDESSYATDSMPPRPRGERTKKGQMKELDEYSVAISVQDDPALVQCLRFYHCAAAATIAGFASGWLPSGTAVKKEVKMLGRGVDLDEVDKMRYRDSTVEPMSPKVEVVLEQDDETSTIDGDERDDDDATVDAPDLKAAVPNVNSYLREVTSLSLRLDDGGLEERRQQPALDRGRAMAAEAEVDINITEIAIPQSSSIKIQKRFAKQNQREEVLSYSASSNTENRDTGNTLESSAAVSEVKKESAAIVEEQTKPEEEYSPEIEIINKKSSGSSEESSRPATPKKGISKLFSRFGRKAKKSMSSSTSASE